MILAERDGSNREETCIKDTCMELRREAKPVGPNNGCGQRDQAMAACDTKRDMDVGIDRVNGANEVEKEKNKARVGFGGHGHPR